MKLTIAITVGTRPEAIKMAPIYKALQNNEFLSPLLISTGQHKELLTSALDEFGISADIDLDVMKKHQSLESLTSTLLHKFSPLLDEYTPDAILVQGDTTSAMTCALSGFYKKIPIGHVEAGLRTGNPQAPWPEEINRRLIAPLAKWHFAPTALTARNLELENVPRSSIYVTGNTVVDALQFILRKHEEKSTGIKSFIHKSHIPESFACDYLEGNKPLILVTAHRRESFGAGILSICDAILDIAKRFPEAGFIYPVHPNPNINVPVYNKLSGCERIQLIPPIPYCDFIWLMRASSLVLSDSGGVQEEAPSVGRPALIMRETTERPEGITAGICKLVGLQRERIVNEASKVLENIESWKLKSMDNPYGDGNASEKIIEHILASLRPYNKNLIHDAQKL